MLSLTSPRHVSAAVDEALVIGQPAPAFMFFDLSGQTVVFLSTEGVRLAQESYADDIHEDGFAPLKQLMTDFVDTGGAKAVEFLTSGASSITY